MPWSAKAQGLIREQNAASSAAAGGARHLLEELTDATRDGTRKEVFAALNTVPLLIFDHFGMRRLPRPRPKICSNWPCAATNAPPRSAPPIAPSNTAASCLATPPP